MFLSQSEIAVPAGGAEALERAFRARSRLVDGYPGFLGLELLRDIRGHGRYVLITRWRSRADFRRYLTSADFRAAHARQHPGVEEPSGGAPLRQFEAVDLDPSP
jgi:heme oxygenase (mycobilin-producing)